MFFFASGSQVTGVAVPSQAKTSPWNKGVGKMAETCGGDGNDVEAQGAVREVLVLGPVEGGAGESFLFSSIDSLLGGPIGVGGAVPDFHKNHGFCVFHHQVHFAAGGAGVGRQTAIALGFKPGPGLELGRQAAIESGGHAGRGVRVLRTGEKLRRCKGQGPKVLRATWWSGVP